MLRGLSPEQSFQSGKIFALPEWFSSVLRFVAFECKINKRTMAWIGGRRGFRRRVFLLFFSILSSYFSISGHATDISSPILARNVDWKSPIRCSVGIYAVFLPGHVMDSCSRDQNGVIPMFAGYGPPLNPADFL